VAKPPEKPSLNDEREARPLRRLLIVRCIRDTKQNVDHIRKHIPDLLRDRLRREPARWRSDVDPTPSSCLVNLTHFHLKYLKALIN
jgi:hypothetical protein